MDAFGQHINFERNSEGFTQYCEVIAKILHETSNPYQVSNRLFYISNSMHLIYGNKTQKFKKIFSMSILQLIQIASKHAFQIYLHFIIRIYSYGWVCVLMLAYQ